jgi:hypothetical protein
VRLGKYIKAAFLNHWNLLAVAAGTVFGFLTGRPDVVLPLVAAGEALYLGMLGTHPRYQSYIEAQEAKEKRERVAVTGEKALRHITDALPADSFRRYDALRERCRELRQIALDLRQPGHANPDLPLEGMQLASLDRLLWIFLRLLYTEWSLERFFMRTHEDAIGADIDRLEKRLAKYPEDEVNPRRLKARKAIADNLETSRARLANHVKARENYELVQLEIDRLENKIRTLSELAVNRQDSGFISDQVDSVASSMLETERTMNELQFATGLSVLDEAAPELLSGDATATETT